MLRSLIIVHSKVKEQLTWIKTESYGEFMVNRKEGCGERIVRDLGKWITNKDLEYSIGKSAQWQLGWEGSLGENGYI